MVLPNRTCGFYWLQVSIFGKQPTEMAFLLNFFPAWQLSPKKQSSPHVSIHPLFIWKKWILYLPTYFLKFWQTPNRFFRKELSKKKPWMHNTGSLPEKQNAPPHQSTEDLAPLKLEDETNEKECGSSSGVSRCFTLNIPGGECSGCQCQQCFL